MSGLEEELTIVNECHLDLVAEPYRPILEDAIQAYMQIVAENAIDVRLVGSVPRGRARLGESDIDFVAICSTLPTGRVQDLLRDESSRLASIHPFVINVDLEVEAEGTVDPARRFIFITDSISIYGRDMYPQKEFKILKTDLAKMCSPPLDDLVRTYDDDLAGSPTPDQVRLVSRWAGKDLLKHFRWFLIEEHGVYEQTIADIKDKLVHRH
jgi:predicted nucleotidyltransferase